MISAVINLTQLLDDDYDAKSLNKQKDLLLILGSLDKRGFINHITDFLSDQEKEDMKWIILKFDDHEFNYVRNLIIEVLHLTIWFTKATKPEEYIELRELEADLYSKIILLLVCWNSKSISKLWEMFSAFIVTLNLIDTFRDWKEDYQNNTIPFSPNIPFYIKIATRTIYYFIVWLKAYPDKRLFFRWLYKWTLGLLIKSKY